MKLFSTIQITAQSIVPCLMPAKHLIVSITLDYSHYLEIKGCVFCTVGFLIMLYTNQQLFVKWNNTFSSLFCVSNGVKSGGVLSPILFNMYLDVLLLNLQKSGFGCIVILS